mmetsp:Transcript_15353/g.39041  ORF Transcript_15353/g.39041 Transcript_15353/m.39041 type:complete len:214 (+) Transcript_15353:35-676(+)
MALLDIPGKAQSRTTEDVTRPDRQTGRSRFGFASRIRSARSSLLCNRHACQQRTQLWRWAGALAKPHPRELLQSIARGAAVLRPLPCLPTIQPFELVELRRAPAGWPEPRPRWLFAEAAASSLSERRERVASFGQQGVVVARASPLAVVALDPIVVHRDRQAAKRGRERTQRRAALLIEAKPVDEQDAREHAAPECLGAGHARRVIKYARCLR